MNGDYTKMSLITEIMFKKFYDNLVPKRHYLLNKLRIAKKTYQPLWIWLFDFKCFFFYQQHFILSESVLSIKRSSLLNTRLHFVRFSFPFSSQHQESQGLISVLHGTVICLFQRVAKDGRFLSMFVPRKWLWISP